jgi:hypothetical protein
MIKRNCVVFVTLFTLAAGTAFAGHDYYKHLRYPSKLVPGVGVDKIEQGGGPDAVGYRRRTVTWWPRKGQDFVDVPEGAPLRTWMPASSTPTTSSTSRKRSCWRTPA